MSFFVTEWHPRSAPEPAIQRRGEESYPPYTISHSVPGNHNSQGYYHIDGFATQPQGGIYDDQSRRVPTHGAARQYQRLEHNPYLNSQFTPIYNGTQPFGYNFLHNGYQSMQLDHNQTANQPGLSPVAPPVTQEYDMESMFEQEPDSGGPMSSISPQSFTNAVEQTYQTMLQPSLAVPISAPAPIQPPVSPEHSLQEAWLGETASHLHERYTNHRITTTSGDLSTLGSMLFSEDPPPPKKAPISRINHYVTLDPLSIIETNMYPVRKSKVPPTEGRNVQLHQTSEPPETPVLEGGIDSFCARSFPHDEQLREALRGIMLSDKPAEAQDLYQFIEICEGKKRRCRFGGDSGPCGEEFNRRDLVVGHIRQAHIKMLPIPCKGDCGDPKCSRWFSSPTTKGSHTRKGSVKCDKCHLLTSRRNLVRHQRTAKCHSIVGLIAIAEL